MTKTNTKNMTNTKEKKSRWGIGIIVLYGSFVLFILTAVIFSTMQDFTLVEDNYYQKSLSFQDKINQQQNTNNLTIKPIIVTDNSEQTITIKFPDSQAVQGITGTAYFFRPSDKRVDQYIPLELSNNSEMVVSSTRFLKGLWVLKLSWESSGISYYQEENLTI